MDTEDSVLDEGTSEETPARTEWPSIALGVTRGMENDAYHGDRSAVSSTQLKRMLISPAHFMCGLADPEESTEAMQYGTVLHGRLLEPDSFASRFYAIPKTNRSTKAGRAIYDEHMQAAAGRFTFPAEWLDSIERIVDNAHRHRRAHEILSRGEAEVAFSWIDAETGIKLKIKADWMSEDGIVADVKSAVDVSREGFGRACARLRYPLSAYMYYEGVRVVTGVEPRWAFIACEKDMPNTVNVFHDTPHFMRRGREMFRTALNLLAECRARGTFPMMQGDGEWEPVELPRWA